MGSLKAIMTGNEAKTEPPDDETDHKNAADRPVGPTASPAKDSFDRFGDDLCGLLLSYFPLKDCQRHEGVSHQWQRVIYKGQQSLHINYRFKAANGQQLATLLQKLKHIQTVIICPSYTSSDLTLRLITIHCRQLKSFDMGYLSGITSQTLNHFFAKFGPQMHNIDGLRGQRHDWLTNDYESCVKQCGQLRHLPPVPLMLPFSATIVHNREQVDERRFKHIRNVRLYLSLPIDPLFDRFVHIYGQQLRRFEVLLSKPYNELALKTLMTGLSQMSNLFSASFHINDYIKSSNSVKLFGVFVTQLRCQLSGLKLKQLFIITDLKDKNLMQELIQTVNEVFGHRLRRFMLSGTFPKDCRLICGQLNRCRLLTHLELLINIMTTDHQFFSQIWIHLPRLVYLRLENTVITKSTIESLSKLPKLRVVRLYGRLKCSKSVVTKWVQKCPNITSFFINGLNYC